MVAQRIIRVEAALGLVEVLEGTLGALRRFLERQVVERVRDGFAVLARQRCSSSRRAELLTGERQRIHCLANGVGETLCFGCGPGFRRVRVVRGVVQGGLDAADAALVLLGELGDLVCRAVEFLVGARWRGRVAVGVLPVSLAGLDAAPAAVAAPGRRSEGRRRAAQARGEVQRRELGVRQILGVRRAVNARRVSARDAA